MFDYAETEYLRRQPKIRISEGKMNIAEREHLRHQPKVQTNIASALGPAKGLLIKRIRPGKNASESAMNLPASPRSLSRSADFGLLRIDRGLDRMADGIERCRLAAGKRIPFGEMS